VLLLRLIVNQRFEVSIPEEKKLPVKAPAAQAGKTAPSFAEVSKNPFALLSQSREDDAAALERAKKGKAKELRGQFQPQHPSVWSDGSSDDLIITQFSDDFSSQPPQERDPASPQSPSAPVPATVAVFSTPVVSTAATSQLPASLLNFRPNLPVEDEEVVEDWTQLLPEDASDSE